MAGRKCCEYLGSGTSGIVRKYQNEETGTELAIKEYHELYYEAYREINILRRIQHPNIIAFRNVFVKEDKLKLEIELGELSLRELLDEQKTLSREVYFNYLSQMLQAVAYLHSLGIIHRDIKPHNIVIKQCRLLLVDFGSSFQPMSRPMTPEITTLWYRAPEVLLCDVYGPLIDIFAIGCIFYEMIFPKILFCGDSETEQLEQEIARIGSLTEENYPGVTALSGWDDRFLRTVPVKEFVCDQREKTLLEAMVCYPSKRKTAPELLSLLGNKTENEKINLCKFTYTKPEIRKEKWNILVKVLIDLCKKFQPETLILAGRLLEMVVGTDISLNGSIEEYIKAIIGIATKYYEFDSIEGHSEKELEIGKMLNWNFPIDGIHDLIKLPRDQLEASFYI